MKETLRRLWCEDRGQDLTEYGLLLVLVALSAVAAMNSLATGISAIFSSASGNLTS